MTAPDGIDTPAGHYSIVHVDTTATPTAMGRPLSYVYRTTGPHTDDEAIRDALDYIEAHPDYLLTGQRVVGAYVVKTWEVTP